MASERLMCPSAPCEPGAVLLGVVVAPGQVAYIGEPVVIDDEFVQIARAGRSPEKRFRFSAPCVRGACRQWTGTRCGVVDAVMESAGPRDAADLPACSIRPACRWFHQSGAAACATCPEVLTDNSTDLA